MVSLNKNNELKHLIERVLFEKEGNTMEYFIDGRNVETSNIIGAQCSDFTVYEDKIWRIVSIQGNGINCAKILEREESKERIVVKGMVKLYLITKPTGFIRV